MLRREAQQEDAVPAGMTRQDYAAFMLQDALIEGDRYDMLVMGRTQGKSCHCYVSGVLPSIDLLLLSDGSRRGIQAAGRIAAMVQALQLKPGRTGRIVNRASDGIADAGGLREIARHGPDLIGLLPQDETVYR